MVASMNPGGPVVDLIYDDGQEPDEEDDVPKGRVVAVADDTLAQSRLHLNAARCLLKSPAGRTQEAAHQVSLVVALLTGAEGEGEEDEERRAARYSLLGTAYQVRAGALCRAGQFARARRDADRLARLPGQRPRAVQLRAEVDREEERRQKANRKLVKTMSAWIQTSMQSYEAHAEAERQGQGQRRPPAPRSGDDGAAAAGSEAQGSGGGHVGVSGGGGGRGGGAMAGRGEQEGNCSCS
jgi:hypothetical protein